MPEPPPHGRSRALELAGPAGDQGRLLVLRPPGLDRLVVVRLAPGADPGGLPGLVVDVDGGGHIGPARAARTIGYLAAELAGRGEAAPAVELTGAAPDHRLTARVPPGAERADLAAALARVDGLDDRVELVGVIDVTGPGPAGPAGAPARLAPPPGPPGPGASVPALRPGRRRWRRALLWLAGLAALLALVAALMAGGPGRDSGKVRLARAPGPATSTVPPTVATAAPGPGPGARHPAATTRPPAPDSAPSAPKGQAGTRATGRAPGRPRPPAPAAASAPGPTPTSAAPAAAPAAAPTWRHHVQGTCRDGACGMKVRTAPSLSAPSVGVVLDGQAVDVACQGGGDAVSNGRASSSIWDRLADGTWVSDFYVDTANVGRPSPPIPACA